MLAGDVALELPQLDPEHPLTQGISRCWVPDEAGQSILDIGPQSAHMSITNTGGAKATPIGKGVNFDGTTTFATTSDVSNIPARQQDISVMFRCVLNNAGQTKILVCRWGTGSTQSWILCTDDLAATGKIKFYFNSNNGTNSARSVLSTNAYLAGDILTIVASANGPTGTTLEMCVNGTINSGSTAEFNAPGIDGAAVTIGAEPSPPSAWGAFEFLDCRLWNRVLLPEEKLELCASPYCHFIDPIDANYSDLKFAGSHAWHTSLVKVWK